MADSLPTSPTSARRCGLAIALPLDRRAVETALAGGPYPDYVGRGRMARDAERLWHSTFADVARAANALAQVANGVGVRVATNATLADVGRLFGAADVVTIVAHWRGAALGAQDLRLEPMAIIERLSTDGSPLAATLRAGFPAGWRNSLAAAASAREARSRLAELLDQRLRTHPFLVPAPDEVEWHVDAVTLHHMNRDALDSWWPEAFVPGNRLELADGLFAPDAIGRVVPPGWTGIADMSNCMSAQLAAAIKQDHPNRSVICNEGATDPLTRLPVLGALYQALADEPLNYLDARLMFAAALRSAGRAAARGR